MGHPHHKPTEASREKVMLLKSGGMTHEIIARIMDINDDTLVAHYKKELEIGLEDVNGQVIGSLFQKAKKGDTAAIIFWLKTRARWKTADNESMLESNDALKEEIRALRANLDAENKKEY